MKNNYLVISTSLNPSSKSRILAKEAQDSFSPGCDVDWLDLKEMELPLCDGGTAYKHPNIAALNARIEKASGILMAVPIYNFATGSAAKNLIELTGSAWEGKIVGFLCAAGGKSSYMSVMGLANSLMLDFRCLIVPKFVYAEGSAFGGNRLVDGGIKERLNELVKTTVRLTECLSYEPPLDGKAGMTCAPLSIEKL